MQNLRSERWEHALKELPGLSFESGAGDSEESQTEWECHNQASKRPRLDSTVSSYASEKEERAGDDFPRMAFRDVLVVVEANEAVEEIFDLKVASRMKKWSDPSKTDITRWKIEIHLQHGSNRTC